MTGALTMANGQPIILNQGSATSLQYIRFQGGDNDYGRIGFGATASNAGYLEIATADDGNDPIYVRQYSGMFANLTRTAALLDGSGNTQFPGTVQANYFTCRNTTLCTNLNADMLDGIQGKNFVYYKEDDFDPATYDGYYMGMTTKSGINTSWWHIISMNWGPSNTGIVGNKTWATQLALPTQDRRGLKYRTATSSTAYTGWIDVLDTTNYASLIDGRYVKKAGDRMSGSLATEGSLEIHLYQNDSVNPMLLFHNQDRVWANMTFRRDNIFHFVSADDSAGVDYRPLKARYYLAYTTDLCTNLNADLLDGNHENAFLRYRGHTTTAEEGTLWSQIGIKQYNGVYPDGLSNGVYNWGAVLSLAGSYSRLDIWYNHQSSGQTNNGIQYRSGWENDKKPWRMILDSVNYTNYADGRYVNVSGDTMTGALNFANGIRNSVGDDCGFGDYNEGGCVGFQGLNGTTGISLLQQGTSWSPSGNRYRMTWNGSNMTSSSTAQWNNLNADLLDGLHQTSFLRTNGANQYVTLTGGSGNTAGWRLVMEAGPMGGWGINSMTLLVNSRHQGTGIISLVFHTTNADGTTYVGEVRYYGSLTSMDQNTWRAFYNTSTKKLKLFWYFYDYSDCYVSILNYRGGTNNISNGTWYTSLPSDRGTELSTYYNAAQYAHQLYTPRTINGTSFNGTANITTSYWGTTRTFYTNSHDSYSISAGVSVNGSGNVTLLLPSSIRCSSWFRSTGATGWYNDTYGGGIYMYDSTYVRVYNDKRFYVSNPDNTDFSAATAISTSGGIYATKNITSNANIYAKGAMTAKSSSSDIRLKKDIKDFSAMDILRKIQPKQFYWNELAKTNSPALNNDYRQYGLIAQSIQNMPELEGFVDNVFKDYLIIHYEKFIPIALEGLKEMDDEVTKLKRRVEVLERENEVLKRRIPA